MTQEDEVVTGREEGWMIPAGREIQMRKERMDDVSDNRKDIVLWNEGNLEDGSVDSIDSLAFYEYR